MGHTVYRKPTYTDRYLHSNHHPQQKRGIIKTLADRARNICEPELLNAGLKHLIDAFLENGYSSTKIRRALRLSRVIQNDEKVPMKSKVFLPFIKDVTDRIGKNLTKWNVDKYTNLFEKYRIT